MHLHPTAGRAGRRAGGTPRRFRMRLLAAAFVAALALPATALEPAVPVPAGAIEALRRQDFTTALAIVDEALAVPAAAAAPADAGVLTLRVVRAQACYGLGRLDDALAALGPFREAGPGGAPLVSPRVDWSAFSVLGDTLMARGEWAEALVGLEHALALVDGQPEGTDAEARRGRAIDRATTLGKIGTVHARLGQWEAARDAFERQEAALAGEPDGGGVFRAAAQNGLGLVADNAGDHATAARHYAEAARIYEDSFGIDHPYTKRALVTLHRVQGKLGNEREVAAIAEKLAAAGTDVAAPVPATLPLAPADAAPSRGLPGWPVLAAIVAGGVLVWLLAGGRSGRRGDDGDDSGEDGGEDGGEVGGPARPPAADPPP
ncbi:MAG: tetratricopeptide repeat protein [Planctomycetaceae bacterium]